MGSNSTIGQWKGVSEGKGELGEGSIEGGRVEERREISAPVRLEECKLEADFKREPDAGTKHFFVEANPNDPNARDDVGGLDPDVEEPTPSPTFYNSPALLQYQVLDAVTPKWILPGNACDEAVEGVRTAWESATQAKEHQKQAREDSKKQKAAEKEEATARKHYKKLGINMTVKE